MNYYEVFGIPVSYRLDQREITKIYLEKQKKYHPDVVGENFSSNSSLLNEAYEVLKDPVLRAEHFLTLKEINIKEIPINSIDAMEMLEMREQYEALLSIAEKKDFLAWLRTLVLSLVDLLYDLENNLPEFCRKFIRMRFFWAFLDKVASDVYCRD
ncbi:MAG: Fe-S protein assembly co-chaperone HscB [Holosporaceae bacterium]|jgi:molecular chaperone HscB|nr:Fe-S protein assembly co-chaperone HscB [Holosporaceae bacterium]